MSTPTRSAGSDTSSIQPKLPSTWFNDTDNSGQAAMAATNVYKSTTVNSLVVLRHLKLYADRFETYHDYESEPGNKRTWILHKCELKPSSVDKLRAEKRTVRPRGTWSLTAALTANALKQIELYEFTIDWPTSWAAYGYTSFTLGFEVFDEAKRWYELFNRVVKSIAERKKNKGLGTTSTGFEVSSQSPSVTAAASPAQAPSPEDFSGLQPTNSDAFVEPDGGADDGECLLDSDDDESACEFLQEEDPEMVALQERWVPYRQTNGVAVYHHMEGASRDSPGPGALAGEFMVSTVVRGSPMECAALLTRNRANTTVLGPAAFVEVLKSKMEPGSDGKDVLRIVLTATGHAGYFCAPREIILERLVKEEEDGVVVVLFQSVEAPPPGSAATAASSSSAPSAGAGGNTAQQQQQSQSQQPAAAKSLFGQGLWRRPVRGRVQGGYTIAGLKGSGKQSPESLITCVLKVDLGGAVSQRSPLRLATCWALGWADSFLDRMLMAVQLLRDEVEQRRFLVQPFSLGSDAGRGARMAEDGLHVLPLQRAKRLKAALVPPLGRMASTRGGSVSAAFMPDAHKVQTIQEEGGEQAEPAAPEGPLDLEYIRSLSLMDKRFFQEIHTPNTDAPFMVRGPTYLKDRKKTSAGQPQFLLGSMNLVACPGNTPIQNVARYLPCIQKGGAAYNIIINIIVPGNPVLVMAAVFVSDKHPSILGKPPANPMEEEHDWTPFDFVLHRFVNGTTEERNRMLKLIPHIAEGSWMIKQSVGSTPAILGKALKVYYHQADNYLEVDVDVTANSVANYVTGLVRGTTKSLAIDLGFVLEGQAPWELPEALLGAFRLTHLDCSQAQTLDIPE